MIENFNTSMLHTVDKRIEQLNIAITAMRDYKQNSDRTHPISLLQNQIHDERKVLVTIRSRLCEQKKWIIQNK